MWRSFEYAYSALSAAVRHEGSPAGICPARSLIRTTCSSSIVFEIVTHGLPAPRNLHRTD